jgi:ankyrin repeat protein
MHTRIALHSLYCVVNIHHIHHIYVILILIQDEYGITPLMYSVWGGHVECVKYFVSNDFGVAKTGVKRSSLDMVSSKGYSALHLAGKLALQASTVTLYLYLCLSL